MEPKNQDLKGEKNGITNSTVTVSTLVVGPIFRKVSEACSLRVNRQDDSDFNYRISSHLSSNKFPKLTERANIIFYLYL
ncbi:unnamed protein product [Rhizophagus irregularis]|nr:unnamed protein product [Rhizophagus irregularis]CAB5360319.1 unnamed protein product [Rhizophagus irregularis]